MSEGATRTEARRMRSDAVENRRRILEAAREAFGEGGGGGAGGRRARRERRPGGCGAMRWRTVGASWRRRGRHSRRGAWTGRACTVSAGRPAEGGGRGEVG